LKVYLSCDDLVVEISDKDQRYAVDVLDDWCARASALMQEQRALAVCLAEAESHPHLGDA
jgi:hypothetical protein